MSDTSFYHVISGFNFRMTNFQAALGLAQINKINKFLKKRKKIFKFYRDIFKENLNLELLPTPKNTENSYWLYTLRIKKISFLKRNKLINLLMKKGIEIRPGFYPLSEMRLLQKICRWKF